MNTLPKYFDLHVSGLGYLNRIRFVQPKKGDGFLACSVAALRGDTESVEYTYFDTRVSGRAAQVIVDALKINVNAGRKVLIGFKIGDIYPESYEITKGESAGKSAITIKGRLLQVNHVRIDGDAVDLTTLVPQELADHAH